MQTITTEERTKLVSYLPTAYRTSDMLDAYIEQALLTVSRQYFGESFVYALSLVVAHKICLSGRGNGETGSISSVREGDISISYAQGGAGSENSYYSGTSFGVEFLQLKKQHSARPRVTGGIRMVGGFFGNLA